MSESFVNIKYEKVCFYNVRAYIVVLCFCFTVLKNKRGCLLLGYTFLFNITFL